MSVQLFTVILATLVRSKSRPHRPFSSAFVDTQEQVLYTVIWSLAGREAIRSYLPHPFLLFMVTTMWLPQTLSPKGSAKGLLYPRTYIDPLALAHVSEQLFWKAESSRCHHWTNWIFVGLQMPTGRCICLQRARQPWLPY